MPTNTDDYTYNCCYEWREERKLENKSVSLGVRTRENITSFPNSFDCKEFKRGRNSCLAGMITFSDDLGVCEVVSLSVAQRVTAHILHYPAILYNTKEMIGVYTLRLYNKIKHPC